MALKQGQQQLLGSLLRLARPVGTASGQASPAFMHSLSFTSVSSRDRDEQAAGQPATARPNGTPALPLLRSARPLPGLRRWWLPASAAGGPLPAAPASWPLAARGFTAAHGPANPALDAVFKSLNAVRLREELEHLAETHFYIPYAKLREAAVATGAAKSEKDADAVADALVASGVVIRYHDLVYLRPSEVAELVTKALPGMQACC